MLYAFNIAQELTSDRFTFLEFLNDHIVNGKLWHKFLFFKIDFFSSFLTNGADLSGQTRRDI